MRSSFMGEQISDSYPKKQLYNRGSKVVPYSGGAQRSTAAKEVFKTVAGRAAATALKEIMTGGSPETEPYEGDQINDKKIKSQKNRGRSKSGGSTNNRSGGSSNRSNRSNSGNTRGYQSQAGISCLLFNSGVSSGLVVNTRIVNDDYTPLYLSSGYLFRVTDPNVSEDNAFRNELENIIYPLIESTISNRIQRYAGRYINKTDYTQYISGLTDALQVYYCIDNILTYGSNISISNINVGMEFLRAQISAEAMVEFNLLRETLETCNCPNNLLDYIRFMCQSYRTSDAPHAPIVKLNIGGMFDKDWIVGPNRITDILKEARKELIQRNKMVSYLNQAYPSWVINTMPPSSCEACFNPDFFTFWHNQNCCYMSTKSANNGNFEYTISVDNQDVYTDYQIIQDVNNVDGVIFATQTYNIKKSNENKFETYWGVWQPLATVDGKNSSPGDNRYTFNIKCFTVDGRIESCTNATTLGASGIYNLVEYTGGPANWSSNLTKFGAYGFVKLQNVSVRMQTEAFNNTMRFWFMGE